MHSNDNMHLVYVAGGNLSDTREDASTPKRGRRLGFPKYRGKMQDASVQSGPGVAEEGRNSNIGADAQLGPHSHSGEPSSGSPKLVHIRQYAMDTAHVPLYTAADTLKTFQKVYI